MCNDDVEGCLLLFLYKLSPHAYLISLFCSCLLSYLLTCFVSLLLCLCFTALPLLLHCPWVCCLFSGTMTDAEEEIQIVSGSDSDNNDRDGDPDYTDDEYVDKNGIFLLVMCLLPFFFLHLF